MESELVLPTLQPTQVPKNRTDECLIELSSRLLPMKRAQPDSLPYVKDLAVLKRLDEILAPLQELLLQPVNVEQNLDLTQALAAAKKKRRLMRQRPGSAPVRICSAKMVKEKAVPKKRGRTPAKQHE